MTDLPDTMRALMLTGRDALELEQVPRPDPGPGQILVRVAASPVNPSDLMTLKGEYGIGAKYPFVPGLEGSGRVVAAGSAIMGRWLMGKTRGAGHRAWGASGRITPLSMGHGPIPLRRRAVLVWLGGAMSAVNPLNGNFALISLARRGGGIGPWSRPGAGGQLGRMIPQARPGSRASRS